jgi:hypothetical protein
MHFCCANSTLTSKKSIRWGSAEYAHGPSARSRLTCGRGNVGVRIKDTLTSSISLGFYSQTCKEGEGGGGLPTLSLEREDTA